MQQSINDLLKPQTSSILMNKANWVSSIHDVLDMIDNELKDSPSLLVPARAVFFMICQVFGSRYLSVPDWAGMKAQIHENHAFELYKNDIQQAKKFAISHRVDLKKIAQSNSQFSDADSSCTRSSIARKCILVNDVHAFIKANLQSIRMNHSDILNVCMAVFRGLFVLMPSTGQSFYLPACSKLKSMLRDIEICRNFNGVNHRQLSEIYSLSIIHIYRILKSNSHYLKKSETKLIEIGV